MELSLTAKRGGYYRVYVADVEQTPAHTSEREAIEHCVNLILGGAGNVTYKHDYDVKVSVVCIGENTGQNIGEQTGSTGAPVIAAAPAPAPAPTYNPLSVAPALPTLQNELDFYTGQGWVTWSAGSTVFNVVAGNPVSLIFNPDFRLDCSTYDIGTNPDLRGTTEGDDLWHYLQQAQRYAPNNATDGATYQCFAESWEKFWTLYRNTSASYTDQITSDGGAHLYCWGLVLYHELQGGTESVALEAARSIMADWEAWMIANKGDGTNMPVAGVYSPSDNQPRRDARLLHSAVRIAEATGDAADIAFRDLVLDLWLQSPGFETKTLPTLGVTGGMHVLGQSATDSSSRMGTGAYAAGGRCAISFHMGALAEAYWHAHRTITDTTKQAAIRDQVVKMGYWCQEYAIPAGATCPFNGVAFGFYGDGTNFQENLDCATFVDPVYTMSLVNLYVMAYKWSNDSTFLTSAIYAYQQGHKYTRGIYPGNDIAAATELNHFVDTQWASATAFYYLLRNKGALQYTWMLFENGGNPTVQYSLTAPTWYQNATDNTWVGVGTNTFADVDPVLAFPGWSFGGGATYHTAVITNWNGGLARNDYLVIPMCGGHQGSSQNTVFEFGPFTSETPSWHWYGTDPTKYDIPSHVGSPNQTITDWLLEVNIPYYSDGLPTSRHSYDNCCYIPTLRLAFHPYGKGEYGDGQHDSIEPAVFTFTSEADVGGTYEARYTRTNWPGAAVSVGGGAEYDSVSGKVWIAGTAGADVLYSYDPNTDTYLQHNAGSPTENNDTSGYTLSPDHRIAIIHSASDRLVIWDIDEVNGTAGQFVEITTNYTGPLVAGQNIGLEYEPVGQKFVGYNGGATLYTMTPPADYRNPDGTLNALATWSWVAVTNGVGGVTPTAATGNGTYGRFRYIKSIKAFAVINNPTDTAVWVYKVPAGGM